MEGRREGRGGEKSNLIPNFCRSETTNNKKQANSEPYGSI